MNRQRVDYDQLAPTYHSRYDGACKLDGIAGAITNLAQKHRKGPVLDVGCGTGRFLEPLQQAGARVIGVDASMGMLSQCAARLGGGSLAAARANDLPFAPATFSLIYCVNAIHHFDSPRDFIRDASNLLQPGGVLSIVGIDPRATRHRYYYEYFDGSLELDLGRYPSFGSLVDWMTDAQLVDVQLHLVEKPAEVFTGREILHDPFLAKHSNSLLALLPDSVYASGLKRIEEAAERNAVFRSELAFSMITGIR